MSMIDDVMILYTSCVLNRDQILIQLLIIDILLGFDITEPYEYRLTDTLVIFFLKYGTK